MDAKTQWLIDNRDALWNHEKEIVDAVESAYQRGLAEGRKAGLREAVEIVKAQARKETSWFAENACFTAAEAIEAAIEKEDK